MSNHTPEPWTTEGSNGIYLKLPNGDTHLFPIIWSEKAGMDVAYIVPMDDTKRADADRIVSCINNCAGINPEAVPDVVAALREIVRISQTPTSMEYRINDMAAYSRAALAKLEKV